MDTITDIRASTQRVISLSMDSPSVLQRFSSQLYIALLKNVILIVLQTLMHLTLLPGTRLQLRMMKSFTMPFLMVFQTSPLMFLIVVVLNVFPTLLPLISTAISSCPV